MDPKTVLPDFQQFLLSHKLAPEKNISYLANWTSKFLAFSSKQGHADISRSVTEFLNSLEVKENIKDWQVRQAEEAVRLYLKHFRGGLPAAKDTAGLKGSLSNKVKILAAMKRVIRLKHLAYNTELAYLDWTGNFFNYVAATMSADPDGDIPAEAVQNFLSHLAMTKRVASSTQNQALCALVFLFREVLGRDLSDISGMVWAKRGKKLPVVLSVDEIKVLFKHLSGTALLIAQLIYGAGLRIMELARLRVLDIDFDENLLVVRNGKGDKDRSTILPATVREPLRLHLQRVKTLHDKDLAAGFGEVYLPASLARKYLKAAKEWKWQYAFPSANLSVDPRSGKVRRHHVSDKGIQLAVGKAVKNANIVKHATVHTLRHSFATHLLMKGVNIREIQDLLGHKSLETTMIYTHVLRDMQNVPLSPLDDLMKDFKEDSSS